MSGSREAGEGRSPTSKGARANVTARFALHADRGQDVAGAAAELIRRLQEMANLPRCAYELDVDVQWPDAPALAPGAGGRSPAGSPPDSR